MLARLMILAGVMWAVSSCGSPCDVVSNTPSTVCQQTAGPIQPGVEFVLETNATSSTPTCEVHLNGTVLDLVVTGNICTNHGPGKADPVGPSPASCTVLGLSPGTYSVRGTSTTFTVPGPGVPSCTPQAATF
jgi:hypothetical protein